MEIIDFPKENWPENLKEISQGPKKLYTQGVYPHGDDLIYLCVVGSRRHTSYGKEVCQKLLEGLRGYPIVIVSGLAIGIDTIAHKTAIKTKLKTITFPGSGLLEKALHPKANLRLYKEILHNGGCAVSEFEPDFKATRFSFPLRNRLMVGVSNAVLIIEAEEKSGTLITARLAMEEGRDVLVVPGNIFSPNSKGTNELIRQGATPITSKEELLLALGFDTEDPEKIKKKQQKLYEELSDKEKKLLDILREPTPKDELERALGLKTQEFNTLLTLMEIKKLIKEEVGKIRRW